MRRAEDHREPSQAVWAAYWGYDSCGPGGILDRLFTALRIPQKSWGGLKRLPEVGGISYERRHSYMHLVSNFLQVACSLPPCARASEQRICSVQHTEACVPWAGNPKPHNLCGAASCQRCFSHRGQLIEVMPSERQHTWTCGSSHAVR